VAVAASLPMSAVLDAAWAMSRPPPRSDRQQRGRSNSSLTAGGAPARRRKPATLSTKLHPGTVNTEIVPRNVEVGTDFVVLHHPILMIFVYIG
jgi:hypothetical protein